MFHFSVRLDDKAAKTFRDKITLSSELLVTHMEIGDSMDGKSIAELNGEELEAYRNMLIMGQKRIVLIDAARPVSDQMYYRGLFAKAFALNADNIKVRPSGENADDLAAGIGALVPIAQSYGIGILLENDARSCLSDDRALASVYKKIGPESAGIIYNPLEFVRTKMHPFFHAYYNSKLKGAIRFLRVNDGLFADGSARMPGEGNAELKELASILLARSFKGYFSFTPYFGEADADADACRKSIDCFKRLLLTL